jgi:hypothetical protein
MIEGYPGTISNTVNTFSLAVFLPKFSVQLSSEPFINISPEIQPYHGTPINRTDDLRRPLITSNFQHDRSQ